MTRRHTAVLMNLHPSYHHEKGATVRTTEHIAKPATTPSTGFFALLSGLLPARGTGASRGAGARSWRLLPALLVAFLALTVAPALAAAPTEVSGVTVEDNTAVVATPSTEALVRGVLNLKATEPVEGGTYEVLYKQSKTACVGGSSAPVLPEVDLYVGLPEEPAAVALTGLTPGTEYTVCLRAENAAKEVTVSTPPVTFKTPLPPEKPVTISPAAAITATTATLEGTLNPGKAGEAGTYEFYVQQSASECNPERVAPEPSEAMTGAKGQAVSAPITGLQPNQEYTFCLVATNGAGETSSGSPVTLKTEPSKPAVDSQSSPVVKSSEATLEAQVNPNNEKTSAYIQYSTSSAVDGSGALTGATALTSAELGEGYGDQPVSSGAIAPLSAGVTYYYQAIATNPTGTTDGPVEHFTTVPTPTTDLSNPVEARTATLNGHFTLSGTPTSTQYSFTYNKGPACSGENAANEPSITTAAVEAGTGTQGAPVNAKTGIEGLTPHTEYTACLITTNQYGSETGAPQSFTTLIAEPGIVSESASEVTSTSVVLNTEIDPGGGATTYHFEYIDRAGYEAALAESAANSYAKGASTPESLSIDADNTPHAGEAAIGELEPNTEYHYRVVATNSSSPNGLEGEDKTFTTQTASTTSTLLDGRAWEQVSPINKHGAEFEAITREGGSIQAATDGTAMTYVTNGATEAKPAGNQSIEYSQTVSVRGPSGGWRSREITPPATELVGITVGRPAEYRAFSPDLAEAVVEPRASSGALSPAASEDSLFIREGLLEPTGAHYLPLISNEDDLSGAPYGKHQEHEFIVASANLKHVIIKAAAAFTPEVHSGGYYEWTAGHLTPVTILPNEEFTYNAHIGTNNGDLRNAVSENGELVFWEARISATAQPHLYMREVGAKKTVQLDVPQEGVTPTQLEENERLPEFGYATPDGERVYFKDDERLTANSTAERGKRFELYEYNTTTGKLADITPNPAGPGNPSMEVQGEVIGATDNGEYVYFVANGKLTGTAINGDCGPRGSGVTGTCNLYVERDDGGTRSISFIAVLSGEDEHDWETYEGEQSQLVGLVSRMSPDGHYLAFMSDRSLTGYDNRDAVSGQRDEEVYEYDEATEHLVCVSCNATGARPRGVLDPGGTGENQSEGVGLLVDRPEIWAGRWLAGSTPGWTQQEVDVANYQSRFLSDSGRLFFDSADALVPQDTNGKEDVYEFEPAGVGDCTTGSVTLHEGVGGCQALISSGTSTRESAFLDASESGDDVFFLTAAPLSPQDIDNADDVYDAHVCSSAAPCASNATTSPPCSTADSCRAAPAVQPGVFGAPASGTLSGEANPASPPPAVKPRALTRAQKLGNALHTCRKDKKKTKRVDCERLAKKKYGAKQAKKSARRDRGTGR